MTIIPTNNGKRLSGRLRKASFIIALAGAAGALPSIATAQASASQLWDYDALAPGLGHSPLSLLGSGHRLDFPVAARAKLKTSDRPARRPAPIEDDLAETTPAADQAEEVAVEEQDPGAVAVAEAVSDSKPSADPDLAKTMSDEELAPVVAAVTAAPLRTHDVRTADFPRLRRESLAAISRHDASAEHHLEHARVLLGGMFLPEAYHALEVARGAAGGGQPYLLASIAELEAALEGLGGPGAGAAPDARGDLWAVLQDHSRGKRTTISEVKAAAADFAHQSPAVVKVALPLVLRAAINAGDADLAAGLIETGLATGDLSGSQHRLLEGRLARLLGQNEEAFDHYAAAMAHMDAAGIEARIALVDLAMEQNKAETFPQLREILSQGIAQWRNDDLARQLMVRLASVTEDLGDRPAALSVMSMLMVEYPESEEAELARRRAPLLLSQLAAQARDKEITLETYLVTLRDLHASLRSDLHWVAARRELAESLAGEGLILAAAAEYQAIAADIDSGSPVADRMREEVSLRHAELLIQAGSLGEAGAALAREAALRFPDLAARHAELSLQLDALTRSPIPGAAGQAVDEDPRLSLARSAAFTDRPEEAARIYGEYIIGDNDLPRSDFSRYILATAEAGQIEQMNLAKSATEDAMAESLLAAGATVARPREELKPLSGDGAKAVLSRSREALDAAASILGKKPTDPAE